jgi:DNA polymerase-3 subunit delta'
MGFDSFIGNAQAVAMVREMLRSGRVPGALLFTGPDGVGKKMLAMMLAKGLVCERHQGDFCGECLRCRKAEEMFVAAREDLARRREIKESARRVEGLVYFDLQLIAPITSYILTEQIRQLRSMAYTRPFELPRRVFVVDEAQTIHWQAVDALLKVLEEPPDTTTLILICPNAFELRSTIRSRCRRIALQPVEEAHILALLRKDKRLTKPQQALAARVAAGSVAQAKTFDLAEYERHRQPWLHFLEAVAHRAGAGHAAPRWPTLFDAARALAEDRENFDRTLHIGFSLLRDLLLIREKSADKEVVNLDLLPRLKSWAANLAFEDFERLKSGLDEAYKLQIRNVNQQLGFEELGIEVVTRTRREAR